MTESTLPAGEALADLRSVLDQIESAAAGDDSLIYRFAVLAAAKDAANETLKAVQSQLDGLEPHVLDAMSQTGLDSATIRALGRTVYLKRIIGCKLIGNRAACVEIMPKVGLADLLKTDFNLNTLAGYFREAADSLDDSDLEQAIPEALRDHLALQAVYRVHCVRSGRGRSQPA